MYGLKPMSFTDEVNAPDTVKAIRNAKVDIAHYCNFMRQEIDNIQYRAKGIVEEDDPLQAKLVEEFYTYIREASVALSRASRFGID